MFASQPFTLSARCGNDDDTAVTRWYQTGFVYADTQADADAAALADAQAELLAQVVADGCAQANVVFGSQVFDSPPIADLSPPDPGETP